MRLVKYVGRICFSFITATLSRLPQARSALIWAPVSVVMIFLRAPLFLSTRYRGLQEGGAGADVHVANSVKGLVRPSVHYGDVPRVLQVPQDQKDHWVSSKLPTSKMNNLTKPWNSLNLLGLGNQRHLDVVCFRHHSLHMLTYFYQSKLREEHGPYINFF